jgi:MFS transporter, CP family, cyanate transporter
MTVKTAAVSSSSSRRTGFLVFLGVVLIGANLRAPITALGPVLGRVQSDLSLNDTGAGLLGALPLIVFALLSLIAPAFGRSVGEERSLGLSLALILIGTIVRSLPLPTALWSGTLFISGGVAIANVILPSYVKREFHDCAATLIGAYAAAMATCAGVSTGIAVPSPRLLAQAGVCRSPHPAR